VAGQAQDQVLLGAHPFQVLQLLVLSALIELQGDLQARVLHFKVGGNGQFAGVEDIVDHHQVAAQQLAIVLPVAFTDFQQTQGAAGGVQGVTDDVVRIRAQLHLHGVV
jgi:hypothetical protein